MMLPQEVIAFEEEAAVGSDPRMLYNMPTQADRCAKSPMSVMPSQSCTGACCKGRTRMQDLRGCEMAVKIIGLKIGVIILQAGQRIQGLAARPRRRRPRAAARGRAAAAQGADAGPVCLPHAHLRVLPEGALCPP